MADKIIQSWKERSQMLQESISSVMDQSFPPFVNKIIANIHLNEIKKVLTNREMICLDAGCGYGRVALDVLHTYPKLYIYGIDVAPVFVKLFNEKLGRKGKAEVGDIRRLPFEKEKFDAAWMIVTLMYIEEQKEQEKAVQELLRVLKRSGKLVIIEPNKNGVNFVRFFGLVPFLYRLVSHRKKVETFGLAFSHDAIPLLVKKAGGSVLSRKGYFFFTFSILPTIILGKLLPGFAAQLAELAVHLDENLNIFPDLSYFISYTITKN